MKKQYIQWKVRLFAVSEDIVTESNGDEFGDDVWE